MAQSNDGIVMNNKVFGYCRISTNKQNIERQVRNILKSYPEAIIVKEVYTGTKFQGRKELDKVLQRVQPGDTIVFDSVSRMSRDANEGIGLYERLFENNVKLIFLKEPHINTEVYKHAMNTQIQMTGDIVDSILKGINEYMLLLAKEQIRLAFLQSEKEVQDLHQRTKEGIETARREGKQIGQKRGAVLTVKKAILAKVVILKHNKTYGGTLSDSETQKQAGISRNSLYSYKRELKEEIEQSTYDRVLNSYIKLAETINKKK